MKKIVLTISVILGVSMFCSACSSINSEEYSKMEPKLDLREYFTGPIKAHGIMQDWRGRVVERFDIDMYGEWNGDKGTLKEDFYYYDGTKNSQRVWHISKTGENTYIGEASDIIGKAKGESKGNSIRWAYSMLLPPDTQKYSVKFDDWMWLMNNGVLMNRSYLTKFGLPVGQVTVIMQKIETNKNDKK
jgi:hypothetical protein